VDTEERGQLFGFGMMGEQSFGLERMSRETIPGATGLFEKERKLKREAADLNSAGKKVSCRTPVVKRKRRGKKRKPSEAQKRTVIARVSIWGGGGGEQEDDPRSHCHTGEN